MMYCPVVATTLPSPKPRTQARTSLEQYFESCWIGLS